MLRPSLVLAAGLALSVGLEAQIQPDAVLLRYPDVSADTIVFRYDGDLWLVEKVGGTARRLTTAPGNENLPKFSPDGQSVAFVGGYEGGADLYTLDIAAGTPKRLTFHPTREALCDWTPDGEALLYFSSEVSGLRRISKILKVGLDAGQPEALPVPYGTFGAIDASGTWLAYTMNTREFRTWKRYQGGMAQDIWLFNLKTNESRRITDYPGTDAMPMWHGREVIFLSDRGESARLNLYAFDLDAGTTRALTEFKDADVRFPSIGPEDVVFEAGGKLWRYELEGGALVSVPVTIPGERVELAAHTIAAEPFMASAHPGPGGVRIAVEARGEVFSVPVEEGVTRNLTRTDGVAERGPAWSPDGRWLAFFSDRSGEYEVTLKRADGSDFDGADEHGERRLTDLGAGWKSNIVWSPTSEDLVFSTNDGGLHAVNVASGEARRIHVNPEGQPLEPEWSRDGKWLAWSHRHSSSRLGAIYLHELSAGETHEVTSGMFNDTIPAFDRSEDWLYFVSGRTFDPTYEDFGTTWIYTNASNLMAVPLNGEVENPWALEDPEEEVEEDEEASQEEAEEASEDEAGDTDEAAEDSAAEGQDGADEGEDGDEDEPLEIELEGFEERVIMLPIEAGQVGNVDGHEGGFLYVRRPNAGAGEGKTELHLYNMAEKEDQVVLADFSGGYHVAAKGEKLLAFANGSLGVVNVAADQELEAIDLSGMITTIEPREEWSQLLVDVYRIFRDFFYEEGMHGVDWKAVYERYAAALPDATSRADVHDFIGEMIAELNVGHAYNRPPTGGFESAPNAAPVGLLGCDWKLENGAYRIARILGAGYDADARSPLAVPGVDVEEGDYVLAVNGLPVDASRTIYAAFERTAGKPTELTVNSEPSLDGDVRRVMVEPLASEGALRYRDWVARNRAHVEEQGGGRIGYVHVPNTGIDGQNELVRQFLGQMHKDALIVDERWNAGGQIPTRFIELLGRPVTNYWAIRHGEDWTWPPVGHRGPKCMLINGPSGSGGDAFPYYFRQSGLGKLIGRRTWGGLVGISGNPGLIDGAEPSVPRFAFYELDGTWGVEGHGVEPDIEVLDDPAKMVGGKDPQLDAAIEHLLGELEGWQFAERKRPEGPDRSGAGLDPKDV